MASGDRQATHEIYRLNFPIVSKWILKSGGSIEDGSDIFQEAMVVLFEKAQDPDFILTCSVGTYLFAISKNLWYKRLERKSKSPILLYDNLEDDSINLGGISIQDDLKKHLDVDAQFKLLDIAINQLGEPCSSLIKAFYHQDKNMQEIAATFGYTNAENAKNQKYKCLSRLKKIFFNISEK